MFDMAPNIEVDFIGILGIFLKKILPKFYRTFTQPKASLECLGPYIRR